LYIGSADDYYPRGFSVGWLVYLVGVDLKPKSLKKGNIGLLGLGLLKIPFYFWLPESSLSQTAVLYMDPKILKYFLKLKILLNYRTQFWEDIPTHRLYKSPS